MGFHQPHRELPDSLTQSFTFTPWRGLRCLLLVGGCLSGGDTVSELVSHLVEVGALWYRRVGGYRLTQSAVRERRLLCAL